MSFAVKPLCGGEMKNEGRQPGEAETANPGVLALNVARSFEREAFVFLGLKTKDRLCSSH